MKENEEKLIDANDNKDSECCGAPMSNGICSECGH